MAPPRFSSPGLSASRPSLSRPVPDRSSAGSDDTPQAPDDTPKGPPDEGSSRLVGEQLLRSRTVLAFGEVSMQSAERIGAQLLALDALSDAPIRILINSPGGHVESGDTLFDLIRFLRAPVFVLGTGWVASAGALMFISVPRDRRFALPNTRFLLHQPLGGVGGPATDVEIEARQVQLMRHRLNRLFAEATGQPLEKIEKDTDRNHWLTTDEAIAYGLLGATVTREDELNERMKQR